MKFIISSLVVSLVVNGTSAQELLEAEPVKGLTQLQEDEAAPEAAAEEPAAEVPEAGSLVVSLVVNGTSAQELLEAEPVKGLT